MTHPWWSLRCTSPLVSGLPLGDRDQSADELGWRENAEEPRQEVPLDSERVHNHGANKDERASVSTALEWIRPGVCWSGWRSCDGDESRAGG